MIHTNKSTMQRQGLSGANGTDPLTFALRLTGAFLVITILAACATVKVEPPSKPIEINLNVKIEGELRVKLDREIETLIDDNPDIF